MVILIDEMLALTDLVEDKKIKEQIAHSLGLIVSQGRALGFSVIGFVQDVRKSGVPMRGMFTVRISLRMNEASEAAMILGEDAKEKGRSLPPDPPQHARCRVRG